MRTLITIKIAAALLLLNGCSKIQVTNGEITGAISVATNLAFRYAITDQTKRTTIAKYVSGIAGAARTLTGKETATEAAQALVKNIPPDLLAQYPEIGTLVIPQVVSYYQSAQADFGSNYKAFADRMNAVAAGLEQGVSAYL